MFQIIQTDQYVNLASILFSICFPVRLLASRSFRICIEWVFLALETPPKTAIYAG